MGDPLGFLEATVEFTLQREFERRIFAIFRTDCGTGLEVKKDKNKKEQVRCDRKYIKLVLFL